MEGYNHGTVSIGTRQWFNATKQPTKNNTRFPKTAWTNEAVIVSEIFKPCQ